MGFKVSLIHFLLVPLTSLKKFGPDSFFFFEANIFVLYSFLSHGALCSLDPVLSSTSYFHVETISRTQAYHFLYVYDVYPRLKRWVLKTLIH